MLTPQPHRSLFVTFADALLDIVQEIGDLFDFGLIHPSVSRLCRWPGKTGRPEPLRSPLRQDVLGVRNSRSRPVKTSTIPTIARPRRQPQEAPARWRERKRDSAGACWIRVLDSSHSNSPCGWLQTVPMVILPGARDIALPHPLSVLPDRMYPPRMSA